MVDTVIAIDPGRSKCGVAVVSGREGILHRSIVSPCGLAATLTELIARYSADAVVVGGGTGSGGALGLVGSLPVPLHVVDERLTTERARLRYFRDNPPRGWCRLVPLGLLVPPVTYDDYAAVLLGEDFLSRQESADPTSNG